MLETVLRNSMNVLDQTLQQGAPALRVRNTGMITYVGQGIARVQGLPGCRSEELIEFPGGVMGMAINLDADEIGVLLLGDSANLRAGAAAKGSGRLAETPVGENLLGRVIDASGRVLDDGPPLQPAAYWPIERDAPAIIERAAVSVPLQTGIKVIDALIPVGRGQRELILGDRQTGKTSIAVDTIINQREQNITCIYCAIGQRGTAVAQIVNELRERGAMAYSIVVVASGEDAPGLQFITPYAATSMAEYFMQQGRDVLIVYDDLTRHARAYREISLLLRRPPGREAYPGDIFYVHSRLLERATRLSAERGGGSLTALPIAETQAQDLSAYIPTNLISITDGQIYVSPTLFSKGQLPAVDVGRSVSRVGGASQLPAYRHVTGDLRLSYSQFEELETFSRFATRLDAATRRTIEHGRRIRAMLKQQEHDTLAVGSQIVVLNAVVQGLFEGLDVALLPKAEELLRDTAAEQLVPLCARIEAGHQLSEDDWYTITAESQRALVSLTGLETDPG